MSPTMLAIFITLGLAAIGFIVWLVRLEGKTHANATAIAQKSEVADELHIEMQNDTKGLKVEFYKHLADAKAHHNEEANKEFRIALDRRLDEMEYVIKDIARKLNHLAGRE